MIKGHERERVMHRGIVREGGREIGEIEENREFGRVFYGKPPSR